MKKICYASCCCSKETYEKLWKNNMPSAPTQSVQKYHRLFAQGFAGNGYDVDMISFITVPRQKIQEFELGGKETTEELNYYYLPYSKKKYIRHFRAIIDSYKLTRSILKTNGEFSLGDVLCTSVSLGCMLGTLKERKKFYAIVTDLPTMFAGYQRTLKYYIEQYIIRKASGYIVLTEDMNLAINKENKPYVVLEGHVDAKEGKKIPVTNKLTEKFIVMYAGNVAKKYGIAYLVEGFIKANIKDSELHLYGNGDYSTELIEISKKNPNVIYFGERLNTEIIEAEKNATLLVNPRPSKDEYTKYSFPSKNMEYMLSGTPLLTTILPGMPMEYLDYIFTLKEENAKGMAKRLLEISNMNVEDLKRKGELAREFVLREKTNLKQARKVINTMC